MPVFHENTVEFELEEYCPALKYGDGGFPKAFILLYKRLWEAISSELPVSWKILYWNTSRLVPEIHKSKAHPRYLDIRARFDHDGMA